MNPAPELIYVDTSAFYALLDRSDRFHARAKDVWPALLEDNISLVTTNYVVSETVTVLQYQIGFEAASLWYKDVLGVLSVHWVDEMTHQLACELWMNLGRQHYSLVDCISYITMNQNHIEKVFCFKENYAAQGFELLPPL
jgi:predicted nucleic acid-binding protein